jgi:hypothetical protein
LVLEVVTVPEEFTSHRCPTCGGVSHPATGCAYTPTFIVCGPCTREAWKWIVEMTNSKGRRRGRPAFYDHVNRISAPINVIEEVEVSRGECNE